jgi:bifunctional non-homologous end joining protein LigD
MEPPSVSLIAGTGGSAVPVVERLQVLNTQGVPLPLLQPMLAMTGEPGGDAEAWCTEAKWDGWRALIYVDDGLRVRTRTGRQVADSLPELSGLVDSLDGHRAILDGELIACVDGAVDFYRLAPRMQHTGRMASWAATQVPVTFVAFDLLHLDGQDLTGLPLVKRKRLLDELHLLGPAWITNGWYPGDGDDLFTVCVELGHEGVVAKRLDAPYLPGKRARTWLKKKTVAWKREDAPRRRPRVWA